MEEFRSALAHYLIGGSDIAELEQALDQALAQPGSAPQLEQLLDELFQSGRLSHQVFAVLKRRLEAASRAESGGAPAEDVDEGQTVFQSPSAGDDSTRFAPQTPGTPPPPAGADDSEAPDEHTRILPQQPPGTGGRGPTTTGSSTSQTDPSQSVTSPSQSTGGWSTSQQTGNVSQRSQTGASATGPGSQSRSGSNWSHPSQWSGGGAGAPSGPLDVGDVLQNRYLLDVKIGQGGMGTVYKARDLLQEEAQDRNPFIAVKILNEDFKRHPKALQALQRETRKAQDLAHPNIVNVFGFDRDGDNVFMTMEYLEGEPLDKFNRRHALQGVGMERALSIVRGLADGLSYAHAKGVVHSDFKPGNAFLTSSDVVKIFDFGIARAAGSGTDEHGEKTLFDAGELGALTPAYASCEMFEGQDPDPRDDIYALAIMTYELLAGKHPFDKLSAVKARDAGMVPEPIKGISRRQWRAILHGLAFRREDRTPTVEQFIEELVPRKLPIGLIVTGGVAASLIIAIAIFGGGQYLESRRVERLIADIQSGDDALIKQRIPDIDEMRTEDPDLFDDLFDDRATRSSFFDYFARRVKDVWAPAEGRLDYPQATQLLARAGEYLPEYAPLDELHRLIDEEKASQIVELYGQLDTLLGDAVLVPSQGQDNALAVIAKILEIDPADEKVALAPERYREVAVQKLNAGDLDEAQEIVASALVLAPDDLLLRETSDEIANEQQRIATAERIGELEQTVAGGVDITGPAAQLESFRETLGELVSLDPANATARQARDDLEQQVAARLASLSAARQYGESYDLLSQVEGVVSEDFLAGQRTALERVAAAYRERIDALVASLQEAVAADRLDDGDDSAMGIYRQLERAGAPQNQLATERTRIATGYSSRAVRARNNEQWDEARSALRQGLALDLPQPTEQRLQAELADVDQYEAIANEQALEERQRLLAEQRQRRIDDLNATFESELAQPEFSADDAREALVALRSLADEQEAPADGLARVVKRMTDEVAAMRAAGRIEDALAYTLQAQQMLPQRPELANLEADIQRENEARLAAAREQRVADARARLDRLMASPRPDAGWDQEVTGALADVESLVGADDPTVAARREQIGTVFLDEAQRLLADQRLNDAAQQLERAERFSPDLAGLPALKSSLDESLQQRQREVAQRQRATRIDNLKTNLRALAAAGNVSEAQQALENLRREAPEDPFVSGEAPRMIARAYVDLAQKELDDDQLERAERLWEQADRLAPALGEVQTLKSAIAERRARSQPQQVAEPRAQEQPRERAQPKTQEQPKQEVAKVPARPRFEDPCANPALVGAGRNPRAVCRDTLPGDKRGPLLVVIPAGGPFKTPVAFGRYEITIRDYNTYCESSGQCAPLAADDDTLPLTGVSADQAEAFVAWLGVSSGARYRIPTAQEWEYAANANGAQPDPDWNCQLRMNGDLIKGLNLQKVTTGKPNGWGLMNYVGNAQEWVHSGSSWSARGGAYTDDYNHCSIKLQVSHSGQPDKVTGFRILRELG